ncbi:DUF3986 family protein [Bacillus sp. P14.5]|uniref:DUF3986 family protein n=1 Tax=Bacillus sp. P14.5 TaxID=1983400 RepID=UPI000DEB4BE7|nr:DUF3986 family protein [Bacillus sp. P14.5]
MNFESHQHLHIGYYENGFDLEAVAYKIQGVDKWVVFLDAEQDLSIFKGVLEEHNKNVSFGYEIFTVNTDDLSYESGQVRLMDWLRQLYII